MIARSPIEPNKHICKRVTHMEGDVIKHPPPDCSFKYVSETITIHNIVCLPHVSYADFIFFRSLRDMYGWRGTMMQTQPTHAYMGRFPTHSLEVEYFVRWVICTH